MFIVDPHFTFPTFPVPRYAVFIIRFSAIPSHGDTLQTVGGSSLSVPHPILTALLLSAEVTARLPALNVLGRLISFPIEQVNIFILTQPTVAVPSHAVSGHSLPVIASSFVTCHGHALEGVVNRVLWVPRPVLAILPLDTQILASLPGLHILGHLLPLAIELVVIEFWTFARDFAHFCPENTEKEAGGLVGEVSRRGKLTLLAQ